MTDGGSKAPELTIAWYRSEPILAFGGGERVLIEGLRRFGENGVDAILLLPDAISTEFAGFFAGLGPQIRVVPGSDVVTSARFGLIGRIVRALRGVRRLRRVIRELDVDVIIANEQKELRFLWLCSLGGLLGLPPVVTFIHGSPFQFPEDITKYALVFRRGFREIWADDQVYRDVIPLTAPAMTLTQRAKLEINCAILRAGVRMTKVAFVLSRKNREEAKRLYGARQIEVICPGGYTNKDIDASREPKTPARIEGYDGPILLSICRLISKKRVDLIIRAFRVFLDSEPGSSATLVIGGTGPDQVSFRDLVESLGLTERVAFLGFVPDSDLPDWYAACDVFLSADNSDYDLTVMMALPKGKKIIVSTQYEIPYYLSSLRRFFFSASPTPESFAAKIAEAISTPVIPLMESDAGQLRSMTWESYFDKVEMACRHAISTLS